MSSTYSKINPKPKYINKKKTIGNKAIGFPFFIFKPPHKKRESLKTEAIPHDFNPVIYYNG